MIHWYRSKLSRNLQIWNEALNLNYIDWKHPENNVLHRKNSQVEREDGQGTVRPDIVTFINGTAWGDNVQAFLPHRISQMLRIIRNIFMLFKFVQIVMATTERNSNVTNWKEVCRMGRRQ